MHLKNHSANQAYALLLVLFLMVLAIPLLAGFLKWTSGHGQITARNNEYFVTGYAAEAATEKVLSGVIRDYQNMGEGMVVSKMSDLTYAKSIPSPADDAYWNDYQFVTPAGVAGQTYLNRIATNVTVNLGPPYQGLISLASTYQIISNVKKTNSYAFQIPVGVGQELNLGTIPLFQFAIFYQEDMEVNPGQPMGVGGLVHGNNNIYLNPGSTLTFSNDVSATLNIIYDKKPGDPSVRTGTVNMQGSHLSGVCPLNLPIGTNSTGSVNNMDANVHAILEMPPSGESASSQVGTNRLYNLADLIMIISNNVVTVESGVKIDGATTVIPSNQWSLFLQTNDTFYNKRESANVQASSIDVNQLRLWSQTNTVLRSKLGRDVATVYIADCRSVSNTESGISLINGKTLPSLGLTVATPNPVYIKGDYNTSLDGVNFYTGTSDTSKTRPAAIMADAISVLSGAWNNANSGLTLSSRTAANTTVNAAFLAGIVPTSSTNGYSGGVENYPRFLENWGGKTFTYNGSMVVMFDSRIAKAPWGGTGDVYGVPNRNWAFDKNFLDSSKLPPSTPRVISINRGRWTFLAPNVTSF